jgi:uncharacterized phage-associated protein
MPNITFSESQLSKIGNTVLYLSGKLPGLTKTKLLKLLYILDEQAILKSGIPFLHLRYKVWKFGPVSEELFIDLSSASSLLKPYIAHTAADGVQAIVPAAAFNDDEFSDNDILLMDAVIADFGKRSATELVQYTHRKGAPWHNAAVANNVLQLFQEENINSTEFEIDLEELVHEDARKRDIYQDYIATH